MVLTEFDEEKYLKMMREEEWAEGHTAGLKAGRLENLTAILEDLGEIPAGILVQMKELDGESIKEWTKLAARAESMKEFLQKI